MRTTPFRVALIGSVMSLASLAVAAEDSLTISPNLKLWSNTWNSWDVLPSVTSSGIQSGIENYTSGTKLAVIPGLNVKYGDFSFGGSFMNNTSYGFNGAYGGFGADRKETDVSIGYSLLPSLSANVGYKTVKQSFKGATGSSDYKYSGPFVGLAASAPIGNGFFMYGSVGVGRLDASLPSYVKSANQLSDNNYNSNYRLSEVGVNYVIPGDKVSPAVKYVALSLGYRAQVIDTDVTLPQGAANLSGFYSRSTKARDNTEGLTFGLSAAF